MEVVTPAGQFAIPMSPAGLAFRLAPPLPPARVLPWRGVLACLSAVAQGDRQPSGASSKKSHPSCSNIALRSNGERWFEQTPQSAPNRPASGSQNLQVPHCSQTHASVNAGSLSSGTRFRSFIHREWISLARSIASLRAAAGRYRMTGSDYQPEWRLNRTLPQFDDQRPVSEPWRLPGLRAGSVAGRWLRLAPSR